jgi:hypothetical protein
MDAQTPPQSGIKRSFTESSPDEPRQASKTTKLDSPRSGPRRSSPVDELEEDAAAFDLPIASSIRGGRGESQAWLVIQQQVAALVKITELDDHLTTLTEESAMVLLFQKEDLRVKLEKALEMKSYTEIRRLRTWPSSSLCCCFKSQNALN